MALEVTFSSPPFFFFTYFFPPSLNLCTSLWLQCSHAAEKETKSHKGVEMKRLLVVIRNAKLLTLQAQTPAVLFCFLVVVLLLLGCFWLSLLFRPSRCCRNQRRGDGESEPRYGCSGQGSGCDFGMCPETGNCQWRYSLSLADWQVVTSQTYAKLI